MTSTATAGFKLEPAFTAPGALGFDGVEFGLRDALIQSSTGEAVFEQAGVEVPTSWSMRATNIVASKYFPWCARHTGTRTQREAAHHTGRRYNHRGGDLGWLFRHR